MLVLQTPGEEHAIIQALITAEQLNQFQQLHLAANPEPYYQGSAAAEQTLQVLADNGYNITQENQQDPDWPTWQLARNPLQDKIATLQQGNQALEEQLREKDDNLQAFAKEKETLKEQLQQSESQKAEAQKANAAHKARAEELKQRLAQAEAAFSAKVQAEQQARKQLEQLKAEQLVPGQEALAKEQAAHQQTASALEEARQQLKTREAELAKQAEQKSGLTQRLTNAEQAREKSQKQAEQALEQAEHAKQQAEQAKAQAEQALSKEKEQHQATEQALKTELETLRQKAEQLAPAQNALAKEQAAHKQTATALEEAKKTVANKEQALTKATQKLEEAHQTQQQTEKALEDNKKWFLARKQQAEQQQTELAELKKQNEDLQQQLRQQTDALKQAQQALASETEKREEQQATNAKLEELEEKIASLGSNLTNHIDKKLTNTAKQVEDTLGLQNYLSTGELPLNYHGWPISPDLALYLTERLETQNYDLVIEFGSGTSTVLFAKVLMKKMLRQTIAKSQKRIGADSTSQSTQTWVEGTSLPNDTDLPKRVLTFEHNDHYHQQTAEMLRQAGLEQVVDLVHAPLVDYSYQGTDYLYYDCDKTLAKIAELYEERQPNILVLVDGPPGATGPNARFPALPKLLNHLPKAKFELILDDFNRKEEKEITGFWIELLKNRSFRFKEKSLVLEKGGFQLIIN
ncbi:hypothetical protein [Marinobacter sp. W-8]|uniref:hypothetical protein n=1 Tax=Marinobacter sp. W-8 TaxID=3369658 RepID=UPI0037C7791B